MKAKLLKETFQPKSSDELKKLIEVGKPIHADMLVSIIEESEIGENIKVNCTGAWDRFGPVRSVSAIDINQGNGFEKALFVISQTGTFIYVPDFELYNLPSKGTMLMFYASKHSIYVDQKLV